MKKIINDELFFLSLHPIRIMKIFDKGKFHRKSYIVRKFTRNLLLVKRKRGCRIVLWSESLEVYICFFFLFLFDYNVMMEFPSRWFCVCVERITEVIAWSVEASFPHTVLILEAEIFGLSVLAFPEHWKNTSESRIFMYLYIHKPALCSPPCKEKLWKNMLKLAHLTFPGDLVN